MNQAGLAEKLREKLAISRADGMTIAACVIHCMIEALSDKEDGVVLFPGLGKLYIERSPERVARNTFKNEPLIVPEQNRVKWKASNGLIEKANEAGKIYNIATKPPPSRKEQREAMKQKRQRKAAV